MAGVFKSLDKSDVRITPFRAHKQWTEATTYTYNAIPSEITSSIATTAYDLKTSYGAQISGSNYYYCIATANKTGSIFLMDGNDDYTVQRQLSSGSYISSNLLTGLGYTQKEVAHIGTELNGDKRIVRSEYDFANTTVDNSGIGIVNRIDYIPDLENGRDYIIACGDYTNNSDELYSYVYDGTITSLGSSSLINNTYDYGDYLGATHITSSYMIAVVNKYDGGTYAVYQNADVSGYLSEAPSASIGPFGNFVVDATRVRQIVYKNKGPLGYSPFYITFQNTTDQQTQGLFIGATYIDPLSISSFTTAQVEATIQQINWDVINVFAAKRYYRNQSYTMNEPVHVVTRDGVIYLDVDRTYTFTAADTVTYAKAVNIGQYLGYNGSVVAATINTDHDLFDPESPTLITLYTVSNLLSGKGPVTVVTYNVTDDTFSDPIHLGYKLFTSGSPFIGDNHTSASNFNGEYRTSTVVGLGYDLQQINPYTGYKGNYIYTFDV